jgi:monoamine oxidase
MPRRSMELLAQRGPVLDPQKAPAVQSLLNSVEPIPLYKLFVVYPYAWWNAVGVSQGRSLTDLPVHQCYYWPNGPNGTMLKDGPGVIMTYNDETSVEFWGGLGTRTAAHKLDRHAPTRMFQRSVAAGPPPSDNPFQARLRRNWAESEAPHEMVAEMHRQLVALHNVDYAPQPVDAAFMDWSADPFGGGVHFWNIGYKSWLILEQMTKPVPSFPCYVCGEAWSTNQTWVEGALQTAEIVLQKHFDLPAPGWITKTQTAKAG